MIKKVQKVRETIKTFLFVEIQISVFRKTLWVATGIGIAQARSVLA